jgi:hypothetical protein
VARGVSKGGGALLLHVEHTRHLPHPRCEHRRWMDAQFDGRGTPRIYGGGRRGLDSRMEATELHDNDGVMEAVLLNADAAGAPPLPSTAPRGPPPHCQAEQRTIARCPGQILPITSTKIKSPALEPPAPHQLHPPPPHARHHVLNRRQLKSSKPPNRGEEIVGVENGKEEATATGVGGGSQKERSELTWLSNMWGPAPRQRKPPKTAHESIGGC